LGAVVLCGGIGKAVASDCLVACARDGN